MTKTQTNSNNSVCEKIYKAISFSPVFRTIRRVSLSPTTRSTPHLVEVPITSGSPMPPPNGWQVHGINSQNWENELQAPEINGAGEEGRKEAMGKRVDSLNDRVSKFINQAKIKMRATSNVDAGGN